jgi:hypothetical protein
MEVRKNIYNYKPDSCIVEFRFDGHNPGKRKRTIGKGIFSIARIEIPVERDPDMNVVKIHIENLTDHSLFTSPYTFSTKGLILSEKDIKTFSRKDYLNKTIEEIKTCVELMTDNLKRDLCRYKINKAKEDYVKENLHHVKLFELGLELMLFKYSIKSCTEMVPLSLDQMIKVINKEPFPIIFSVEKISRLFHRYTCFIPTFTLDDNFCLDESIIPKGNGNNYNVTQITYRSLSLGCNFIVTSYMVDSSD